MAREIKNVQLIWDDANNGWYSRHDEVDANGERSIACDNGLDCMDREDVEAALTEAAESLGVDRNEISVIA